MNRNYIARLTEYEEHMLIAGEGDCLVGGERYNTTRCGWSSPVTVPAYGSAVVKMTCSGGLSTFAVIEVR
jgi:hypothetical protein